MHIIKNDMYTDSMSPKERKLFLRRYSVIQFNFETIAKKLVSLVHGYPKVYPKMVDPLILMTYPNYYYTMSNNDFVCVTKTTEQLNIVPFTIDEEKRKSPPYCLDIYFYSCNIRHQKVGEQIYYTGPHVKLTASGSILATIANKSKPTYLKDVIKNDNNLEAAWNTLDTLPNKHFNKRKYPQQFDRSEYLNFITWIDFPKLYEHIPNLNPPTPLINK